MHINNCSGTGVNKYNKKKKHANNVMRLQEAKKQE